MRTILHDMGRRWMMLDRRALPELAEKRLTWSAAAAAHINGAERKAGCQDFFCEGEGAERGFCPSN
jgi:hypothetical protein